MIEECGKQSYYDVLDVPRNSTPEAIRRAYIRAKNAFANDSLAAYSLFDSDQTKTMLADIEEAYHVLSDPDKRREYDRGHGLMRTMFSSTETADSAGIYLEEGEEVADFGPPKTNPTPANTPQTTFSFLRTEEEISVTPAQEETSDFELATEPAPPTDAAAEDYIDLREAAAETARDEVRATFAAPQEPAESAAEPRSGSSSVPASWMATLDVKRDPSAPSRPTGNFAFHGHCIEKQHDSDPEKEAQLQDPDIVDGNFLRQAREYRNVSIAEMMEFTKLSRRYVEALEAVDVDALPAPVYVRGFVIQYAKALRLNNQQVIGKYMRHFQDQRESRGLR